MAGRPKLWEIPAQFQPPWASNKRWSPPARHVGADEALALMERAREINAALPQPSEFIESVIAYFRRVGSVSRKQAQAVKKWLNREQAKAIFDNRPLPPVEEKSRRFGRLDIGEDS